MPRFEFIDDLPTMNWSHPSVQALHQGLTDLDPDTFGVSWGRYQYVDFSTPILFGELHIVAAKAVTKGRIVLGIFDLASSILIGLTFLAFGFLLWLWSDPIDFCPSCLCQKSFFISN